MLIQKNKLDEVDSVVVVVVSLGVEVIGTITEVTDDYIAMNNCIRLTQTSQGPALVPFMELSDNKSPTRFYRKQIVCTSSLRQDLEDKYLQATTSIAL